MNLLFDDEFCYILQAALKIEDKLHITSKITFEKLNYIVQAIICLTS